MQEIFCKGLHPGNVPIEENCSISLHYARKKQHFWLLKRFQPIKALPMGKA